MSLFAKSSGCKAPFFWKSFIRPGCDTAARSGGFPPWTAVESTVGVLSPLELYLTVTFGYFSLHTSSTAWKDFCSSPVHTPVMLTFPLTSLEPDELLLLPPHPAARTASGTASAASTNLVFVMRLLSSCPHRCPALNPDRRNAMRACRRQPRRSDPRAPVTARRIGRR